MNNNKNKIKNQNKNFADKLILRANEKDNWEEIDIANLILLISQELEFNSKSVIDCLNRTKTGSTTIVNHLSENGFNFSTSELISFFKKQAINVRQFIDFIDECLDFKLISLNNEESLNLLYLVNEDIITDIRDFKQYTVKLCEHCDSKLNCGKILKIFTNNMTARDAADFMYDIIQLRIFKDLSGSMNEFYLKINSKNIEETIQKLIEDNIEFNDSDKDSTGSLRDFIVEDDDCKNDKNFDNVSDEDEDTDNNNQKNASNKNRNKSKNNILDELFNFKKLKNHNDK